jgi:hypothetical protein
MNKQASLNSIKNLNFARLFFYKIDILFLNSFKHFRHQYPGFCAIPRSLPDNPLGIGKR